VPPTAKTSGFLTLLKRRIRTDWRFCRAISLAPTCFKRDSASASFSPSNRELSCPRTVSRQSEPFRAVRDIERRVPSKGAVWKLNGTRCLL
jgi:hypothetical protein